MANIEVTVDDYWIKELKELSTWRYTQEEMVRRIASVYCALESAVNRACIKEGRCTCCHAADKDSFPFKDGTKSTVCQDCEVAELDVCKPEDSLFLFVKFDIPLIKEMWFRIASLNLEMGAKKIFEKYLNTMCSPAYKAFRFGNIGVNSPGWGI